MGTWCAAYCLDVLAGSTQLKSSGITNEEKPVLLLRATTVVRSGWCLQHFSPNQSKVISGDNWCQLANGIISTSTANKMYIVNCLYLQHTFMLLLTGHLLLAASPWVSSLSNTRASSDQSFSRWPPEEELWWVQGCTEKYCIHCRYKML